MTPASVYTVIDGRRLHHLDHGGSGTPIVLIHGVLGNAWMWAGTIEALGPHGRVIAVDLRGYGDSQWSGDEPASTDEHATDLAGLADAHGWSSMRIVGFSLGGLVGLALWDRRPELIESLVMVDLPPASAKAETDVQPMPHTVAGHREAVDAERAALRHAPDQLVEVMAHRGWRPGSNGVLERKHDPAILRRWRFRAEDWWPTLERFDRPLLFVHAPESPVCSAEDAVSVADRAPRGQLVEVPESGHLVPLERPDVFTSHVIEFWVQTDG